MPRPFARRLLLAMAAAVLAASPVAGADVLPEPERPAWNEHPPPLPEPPPEKDLERRALPWLAAALALGACAAAVRRRVIARRFARGEGG